MDMNSFKQEVILYSKEIGIDKIGFTSATAFTELKGRLIRQQELDYQSGFEEADIEKRVRPELIFDKPQSIISIALAYPSKSMQRISPKFNSLADSTCFVLMAFPALSR